MNQGGFDIETLLKMIKDKEDDNSPFAASDMIATIGNDSDYARGGYADGGDADGKNKALKIAQDLWEKVKSGYNTTMEGAAKRHEDWLLSHGYSPDIAKEQAQKVKQLPADIAHGVNEWVLPHSATDVGLMMVPGGGAVRKAIGAGLVGLDQMVNPAEAGEGKIFSVAKGLGKLFAPGSGYVSPLNKPSEFKIPVGPKMELVPVEARPIPEIENAAAQYMKSIGREGEHVISAFPKHDPDLARAIAMAYDEMQHSPTDPKVKRAYDAMIDETLAQYKALKDTGIDFTFTKEGQPYAYGRNPASGYADIVNRGRMEVYPTEQGYGTSGFDASENPLLKRVGKIGDLENATANDAFRLVHDIFGHYGPGNPFFRAPGEERAWMLHSKMFSPEALPAMTAETRGQNSWVNFGPHAEFNKNALGGETIYADQKAGIMPDWTLIPSEKYARGGQPTASDTNPPEASEPDDAVKLAMFAGARSRLADSALLKMAEEILRSGKNPLKETGWFKDPQGLPVDWRGAKAIPAWKYEISDAPAQLKIGPEEFSKGSFFHAGELLSHPELFEAYPQLKTMSVTPNRQISYRGHYDPRKRDIDIRSTDMDPELFKSTLLHELQHGLQARELFVPGGSPITEFGVVGDEYRKAKLGSEYLRWLQENNLPDKFSNYDVFLEAKKLNPENINEVPRGITNYIWKKTPEELDARALELSKQYMGTLDPVEAYKRIHGENEAYNVEERLKRGITPEQMREIAPEDTALWKFDQTFQAPGK